MAIPVGYGGQIRSRRGMAKKGMVVANQRGTVAAGDRGELCIRLHNLNQTMCHIKHGDRIAQMVIAPVVRADILVTDELDSTERGDGGFGSTGE